MEEQVIGHYVRTGPEVAGTCDQWEAAVEQSTEIFRALVADDLAAFEKRYVELNPSSGTNSSHTVLFWSGQAAQAGSRDAKVQAKSRTLAMLATHHGSVRVLSYLLSKGSCPTDKAKDGVDCYQLINEDHPNAPSIRGMLNDAVLNWTTGHATAKLPTSTPGAPTAEGTDASAQACQRKQQAENDVVGPPTEDLVSSSDLTRPEYSTDWFRMYCFKVLRCSKRYAHDWRACPFAHPTENARRRDPRDFKYSSLVCPDYKQGCCVRGDTCQYAHGVFESWLHPSRYRTQLCKDHGKCHRSICFFAHSLEELRTPESSFVPGPEERMRLPEPMQAVLGVNPPLGIPQLQVPQLDTAYLPDQHHPPDLAVQQQGMHSAASSSALHRAASSSTSIVSNCAMARSDSAPSSHDQQLQTGGCGSDAAPSLSQPSPKQQQLVSPSAMPVPRMSNAFARKHGLDPKENPLVNLQRLAMQQTPPAAAGALASPPSGGRRGKRGAAGMQQHAYQQHLMYSAQQSPQQMPYQQHMQQQQPYLQQQQHPPPPPLLQPLTLQPQQQLLSQAMLSPSGAAAYFGSPSPLQHLQHSPAASPALDAQAMALLLGGMSIAAPAFSPHAQVAVMAGITSPQMQHYPVPMPSPCATHGTTSLLSPVGALAQGMDAAVLNTHSPLHQSILQPAAALHSPPPGHF